jgi:hypothetical protein
MNSVDSLCGLVVRVLGHRSGGPGLIPLHYHKKKLVGLERGPLSLLSTTEELLGRKSSGSGLEIRDYGRRRSAALTTWHPLFSKVDTNFAEKRWSLGRYTTQETECFSVYLILSIVRYSTRTQLPETSSARKVVSFCPLEYRTVDKVQKIH